MKDWTLAHMLPMHIYTIYNLSSSSLLPCVFFIPALCMRTQTFFNTVFLYENKFSISENQINTNFEYEAVINLNHEQFD